MSDAESGLTHIHTVGGASGTHESVAVPEFRLAPATAAEFNTLRLRLIPIACWRVDDIRFDFDSSIVLPEIRHEMQLFAELIASHTERGSPGQPDRQPPISLFGHADPVGNDDYNKLLSGRRAAVMYGLLTRREEVWEDLFSNTAIFAQPVAGDKWDVRAIQIMLNHLAGPLEIDGKMGPSTQKTLASFQEQNGLAADGRPALATRKKLFRAYMDTLCVDEKGTPSRISPTAGFLAAGGDAAGKGDFQGCGEFNARLIFSQTRNAAFEQTQDKTARNAANAPNRRVMALLFRPGSRVLPARWPCPRAKEGVSGCLKRFFSDGQKRRSTRLPEQDREFKESRDTFACRFYQRLLAGSPCEGIVRIDVRIRLFDHRDVPMRNALFLARFSGEKRRGRADSGGFILLKDVQPPTTVHLQWRLPSTDEPAADLIAPAPSSAENSTQDRDPDEGLFLYRQDVFVNAPRGAGDGVSQRLHNLGFLGRPQMEDNVRAFQRLYGLPETGREQDITPDIVAIHDPGSVKRFVPANSGPPVDNNP